MRWIIVIAGLGYLLLAGLVSYTYFHDVEQEVTTVPTGAKVYAFDQLICEKTPCTIKLNYIKPRKYIISYPHYRRYTVSIGAFGFGHKKEYFEGVRLRYSIDDEVLSEAMKACSEEREALDEKLNLKAKACYRTPGLMPVEADASGHCHVQFDITATGETENIELQGCTELHFVDVTIAAVKSWRYLPETKHGRAVARRRVKSKMTYRLRDEKGTILPEPKEFLNSEHSHDIAVSRRVQ